MMGIPVSCIHISFSFSAGYLPHKGNLPEAAFRIRLFQFHFICIVCIKVNSFTIIDTVHSQGTRYHEILTYKHSG